VVPWHVGPQGEGRVIEGIQPLKKRMVVMMMMMVIYRQVIRIATLGTQTTKVLLQVNWKSQKK
jgi:hypothetical protein